MQFEAFWPSVDLDESNQASSFIEVQNKTVHLLILKEQSRKPQDHCFGSFLLISSTKSYSGMEVEPEPDTFGLKETGTEKNSAENDHGEVGSFFLSWV